MVKHDMAEPLPIIEFDGELAVILPAQFLDKLKLSVGDKLWL